MIGDVHLKPWLPWNCSTAWSVCSTSPAWKGANGSFHSRTVASVEQDTATSPDGPIATPFTAAVCPIAEQATSGQNCSSSLRLRFLDAAEDKHITAVGCCRARAVKLLYLLVAGGSAALRRPKGVRRHPPLLRPALAMRTHVLPSFCHHLFLSPSSRCQNRESNG